jgi:hypothetical protein
LTSFEVTPIASFIRSSNIGFDLEKQKQTLNFYMAELSIEICLWLYKWGIQERMQWFQIINN